MLNETNFDLNAKEKANILKKKINGFFDLIKIYDSKNKEDYLNNLFEYCEKSFEISLNEAFINKLSNESILIKNVPFIRINELAELKVNFLKN